jgi:asparagine synthase (glutamine-hydrolysing)
MCGICGEIYFKGGRTSPEKIRKMAQCISHRGPDQEGFYFSPDHQAGLGHRRLNIIDLSTGNQPMWNEDGSLVIIFNGEIYNFQELRTDLVSKGHVFKTKSDTEVIIHLYEQEGVEGFGKMAGMFAFAIYDEKSKRLVLARDQVGVKPLFYFADADRVVFASELHALVAGIGRLPSLRDEAVFDYLLLQYVPGSDTIFSGVKRLLPGHYLIADPSGVRIGKYIDMKPGAPAQLNRGQAVSELRKMLEESVRSQLIADVPLGAYLSGGIDSSTIVALMKNIKGAGVKTFSVDFSALGGASEVNETSWSKFAAEYFKTEHRQLRVSADDAINCFDRVVSHLDEPVADPACIPTYLISKLARSEVTVVLSGEGADELFGGYLRYRLERLAVLLRTFSYPDFLRFIPEKLITAFSNNARTRKAFRAFAAKNPAERHILWTSVFPPEQIRQMLDGKQPYFENLVNSFENFFSGQAGHFNNILWADFCTWLADDLLVKVDRMSMAVSLEARVPYLDHRLVQKVFSMPGAWKFGLRSGKNIFKDAVSGLIPDSIINRKKAGFTLPLGKWFRNELKGLVTDALSPSALKNSGVFQPQVVEAILSDHFAGRDDLSLQIFSILLFQLWKDRIKSWV